MVTTPHWLASEAGAKILRRGGNAVEALVGASAALSVLYPHFCGLGGDAIWLAADRTGSPTTFLGIGRAVRAMPDIAAIPVRGPLSSADVSAASSTAGNMFSNIPGETGKGNWASPNFSTTRSRWPRRDLRQARRNASGMVFAKASSRHGQASEPCLSGAGGSASPPWLHPCVPSPRTERASSMKGRSARASSRASRPPARR